MAMGGDEGEEGVGDGAAPWALYLPTAAGAAGVAEDWGESPPGWARGARMWLAAGGRWTLTAAGGWGQGVLRQQSCSCPLPAAGEAACGLPQAG